mmetsp:Transcript_28989/g.54464  ORF Transcript_28989/g.54464 Transcript_28989/m.54464 type:complete len:230 (+) Transcript_28989:244-933(+)
MPERRGNSVSVELRRRLRLPPTSPRRTPKRPAASERRGSVPRCCNGRRKRLTCKPNSNSVVDNNRKPTDWRNSKKRRTKRRKNRWYKKNDSNCNKNGTRWNRPNEKRRSNWPNNGPKNKKRPRQGSIPSLELTTTTTTIVSKKCSIPDPSRCRLDTRNLHQNHDLAAAVNDAVVAVVVVVITKTQRAVLLCPCLKTETLDSSKSGPSFCGIPPVSVNALGTIPTNPRSS